MVTNDRTAVQTARDNLAASRHTLIGKLYDFEVAAAALREAQRKLDGQSGDLGQVQTDFDIAKGAFEQARASDATLFQTLQQKLADWLPDGTTEEQDVGRLLATEPILLFPVRLETRFDGAFLKVRVFPDEVFLNTHETALTQAEYQAAREYYEKLNAVGKEDVLWRDMVARFGVERSAYVLREMLPVFGEAGLGQSSSYLQSSSSCGGTIVGGHDENLFFPQDVQFRSSKWTRPGEGVLPDRWLVIVYPKGNPVGRVTRGPRIIEPLAMTPDPKLLETDLVTLPGTTLTMDDKIRWTVDFDRAFEVGMGIKVGLQGNEAVDGYDRVIVVGVKSSMAAFDPQIFDTARHLEKLVDAHHYTRGMAILRQGTPTNNTEGHPTSYPPRENAGAQSFVNERSHAPLDRHFSHHCMPFRTNGEQLSMALGVPSGVFANLDRTYLTDTYDARAMNTALWPGTIGYFMQHMMSGIFTPTVIQNTRSYFSRFVLGRGPAPAFRIGATPYGVLPIASLKHWAPRTFGPSDEGSGDADEAAMASVESGLLNPLKSMFDTWLDGVAQVPRIRTGQTNPDLDVATVLSTCASSREFRIRYGHPEQVQWLTFHFLGWDYREVLDRLDQASQTTFGRIGHSNWRVPIGRTRFFSGQSLFTGDIVLPEAELSEVNGLPDMNFIQGIRFATASVLNQGNVPGKPATPNLLFTLLRHSTMMEYARVTAILAAFNWAEYFILNIPTVTGIVHIVPRIQVVNPTALSDAAKEHLDALDKLAAQTSAELERMFTETLDLTSHRLDAWVGALAYRRLDDMRRAQISDSQRLAPKGNYLGGYGWLEDVRPRTHPTELLDGVPVEFQPKSGGFIHTPSMTHASAAAVLRNGHISFKDENPSAYGIDLSSERVRAGRRLFEGIQNGQPIGALLGYQLERGLHEGHQGVANLDPLRFTLRKLFPLVGNKSGEDPTQPTETIAARNVVDGSLLLRAYKANQPLFGQNGVPALGTQAGNALKEELDKLDQMYDAAADLLTAEGVFQLVRGNIDAAVPTINNLVEGNHPPDSIITRSARGGTGIGHRVALVFQRGEPPNDSPPPLPAGWPSTATPRANAEPVLNSWLGTLIGSQALQAPTAVTAKLTYRDAEGNVITSTSHAGGQTVVQQSVTVRLSELGLHPLDVLALAEVVARTNQGSMLDRQIIAVALGDPNRRPDAPATRYDIDYSVTSGRSFAEVFEVLGTAGSVLRSSRPLELKDLLPPAEIAQGLAEDEAEPIGGARALSFYQRGKVARTALVAARQAVAAAVSSETGVRAALIQAARIAPMTAFPDPTLSEAELLPAAGAVRQELERREAKLPELIPDSELATTASAKLLEQGTQSIQAVFGDDFVALPDLDPPRAQELHLSLEARTTLLDGDEDAPNRYLQQLFRSRDRLGRFRKLNIYARIFGFDRPRIDLVQLPHVPGEKWLGLGFDVPDLAPNSLKNLPVEGRNAVLLLNYESGLDPTLPWTGLVVDDWTETIPNQVEETGIALHYDSPQAQAPQAVLVAVPSKAGANWTFEELLNSLEQTMDLMRIRSVSLEQLDVGPALPMTIMPGNESVSFTVSTLFGSLRVGVDTLGLYP